MSHSTFIKSLFFYTYYFDCIALINTISQVHNNNILLGLEDSEHIKFLNVSNDSHLQIVQGRTHQ